MEPLHSKLAMPILSKTTDVLPIDVKNIGAFIFQDPDLSFLGDWKLKLALDSPDATNLLRAAEKLRASDIPVAFPTETVYGLGADATRSAAVRGIFKAKQRPSDNPLIVHISSLKQLNEIFDPYTLPGDAIPSIYVPLIRKFWPGPLTIIMPLPTPSPFAPEVTATLNTVGVRMPSSPLALALIYLANTPIAAPSANASSRPSPTTASHVLCDLSGRIEMIVDGGPCNVGLESTVVDGLCNPPEILRPGSVSLDMIRSCDGWENVRPGYANGLEDSVPRAPGMKYRHYSPQARVILVQGELDIETVKRFLSNGNTCGILRTKNWADSVFLFKDKHIETLEFSRGLAEDKEKNSSGAPTDSAIVSKMRASGLLLGSKRNCETVKVWSLALGNDTTTIARLLFSGLRQLDRKGVEVIFVEAINDDTGDTAAAVMNRLRKAAECEVDNSQ